MGEMQGSGNTNHPAKVRSVRESQGSEARRQAADSRRMQNWKRWGPYLSERQWGTVREDYSSDGDCWNYFPHDHARSRAYRWGEDGLLGLTDRECRLCFSVALWNGRDPILKERLFGLTSPEGNHGEDVKEAYYYLDSTPTHSYMKALYKYPQSEYPYTQLVEENRRRGRTEPEFELADSGLFDQGRYFDVFVEYAKNDPDDILIKITVANRGPQDAVLHLLPTLWFRNTWSWGCRYDGCWTRPRLFQTGDGMLSADHATLGSLRFAADKGPDGRVPELLFTENETNAQRLFGSPSGPYVKDAFHDYVVGGRTEAVNPRKFGTKAAALYRLEVAAGGTAVVRLRLYPDPGADRAGSPAGPGAERAGSVADAGADRVGSIEHLAGAGSEGEAPVGFFGDGFDAVFDKRLQEADEFFASRIPRAATAEESRVARQAFAGLLWSKQFYHYVVKDWLEGDPDQPAPPATRKNGRNAEWQHLFSRDVISMPDKWEYPWFAAWDLAFHMIPFARIDPEFAKEQLVLFLREWYMHPNGQIPAYEFAFGDVNPPVHAWAAWRVYKMTGERGQRDRLFLERVFQKLLVNFTWWVNRKDAEGKNLFSGGFLGLDNIGVFDRSRPLPTGGTLEQADGTAWMAFYCATMLSMALELAKGEPAYEDMASKFFEHFVRISDAMNSLGGTGLWDEEDGFYYDRLLVDGSHFPLKVRSMVGLLPLIACENLEEDVIAKLPGFAKRMRWFIENRPDLAKSISFMKGRSGDGGRRLLAIPSRERLEKTLRVMLDEKEFLSDYGLRSVSRVHKDHPYVLRSDGREYSVHYVPAESDTGLFGGNSNWRGPIWFPVNYLLVEALERYHHFYGDSLKVECPTGSDRMMNLREVAGELAARQARIFLPDASGRRPCHGSDERYADDPHFRDLVLFYEYFHGDTGRGVGASHQTGWTALAARYVESAARSREAAEQRGKGKPRAAPETSAPSC